MNQLLERLTGGDLRSDGQANEVADEVIQYPHLSDKLVEGLNEPDDVVRARTAHALERISRSHPEMLSAHLPQLIEIAKKDEVPMVRWHIVMIFGNLAVFEEKADLMISTLLDLLEDRSTFVKSWSIVSLSVMGREYPSVRGEIISRIRALQNDESVAIRTKVAKALNVLENEDLPMPAGWLKSKLL
ncbi:MAG: HEAT repeat domain-containing protein [Anaerolineae bacterium]